MVGGMWGRRSNKSSSSVSKLTQGGKELEFDTRRDRLANEAKTILEDALHISEMNFLNNATSAWHQEYLDYDNDDRPRFNTKDASRETWDKIPWDIFNRFYPKSGNYGNDDEIVRNYEMWEDVLFSEGREAAATKANELYKGQLNEEMSVLKENEQNKQYIAKLKEEIRKIKSADRFEYINMPFSTREMKPLTYIRKNWSVWEKAYNDAKVSPNVISPTREANKKHIKTIRNSETELQKNNMAEEHRQKLLEAEKKAREAERGLKACRKELKTARRLLSDHSSTTHITPYHGPSQQYEGVGRQESSQHSVGVKEKGDWYNAGRPLGHVNNNPVAEEPAEEPAAAQLEEPVVEGPAAEEPATDVSNDGETPEEEPAQTTATSASQDGNQEVDDSRPS